MRVLCGQCGHVNELDDDYADAISPCARCGHVIPVPRLNANGSVDAALLAPPAEGEAHEVGFAEQARKAKGRKITITCANCGKTVTVSARVAGRNARCKGCDHPIKIPWPDDLEDFELPDLAAAHEASEEGLELVAPAELDLEAEPAEAPAAEPAEVDQPAQARVVVYERPAEEPQFAPDVPEVEPEPVAIDLVAELAALDPIPHLAAMDAASAQPRPKPPTPHHDGELVSAVQDFHVDRQAGAVRPRKPKAKAGGSRLLLWAALLAAGAAAIALPVTVVVPLLVEEEVEDDITVNVGVLPPVPPAGGHATKPATRTAVVQPLTKPAPKPKVPVCQVVSTAVRAFASDGYFAAPLASVYCRIAAVITAGAEPVRFQTCAPDVKLICDELRYPSLGEPADGAAGLFARSRKTTVALQPLEKRRVTFLFELPADATQGVLFVRRVAAVDVSLPAAKPLPADRLAGTYVETPPRNLRPLLRDPVMAAIQTAGGEKLQITAAADQIRVVIPRAGVYGLGRQVGPGRFRTALRRGGDVLQTTLRFMDGGHQLVLYLADKPFHQLTYVNPKLAPRTPKPPVSPPATPTTGQADLTASRIPRIPPGPGMEASSIWQEVPGYDPNAKPTRQDANELPTGPSIFD